MISERTLIDLLAEMYLTKERSKRVVLEAGMNPALVEFNDRAIDNWSNILSEASNQGKLQALVDAAGRLYEDKKPELQALFRRWPRSTPIEEKAIIPSQPKQHARQDPDILIGRELHWDREHVASAFLDMMKHPREDSWRVLGLQGSKDADLDSLIGRFEEMCRKVKTPGPDPRLYKRIILRLGLSTPQSLALEILTNLLTAAKRAVPVVTESLEQGLDDIEQGSRGLSEHQLARQLAKCLGRVTKDCSVVLLIQRFDELRDSPSAKWLRDWLVSHACNVDRLVIVITGESGLDELSRLEASGIYCPDRLPPMTWQDFQEWARESEEYHFDWFTEEWAKRCHKECDGNPQRYKDKLNALKMAAELGVTFSPTGEKATSEKPGDVE